MFKTFFNVIQLECYVWHYYTPSIGEHEPAPVERRQIIRWRDCDQWNKGGFK